MPRAANAAIFLLAALVAALAVFSRTVVQAAAPPTRDVVRPSEQSPAVSPPQPQPVTAPDGDDQHGPAPEAATSAPPTVLPSPAADGAAAIPEAKASAVTEDAHTATYRLAAENLRAFMAGELRLEVSPASLFDVDPQDEDEIEVDRQRITALLNTIDRPAAPPKNKRRKAERGRAPSSPAQSGDPAQDATASEPQRELFEARLALDRTRLEFYNLAQQQRQELFARHAARQASAAEAEALARSEAQRVAREAWEAQQQAVAAAAAEQKQALEEVEKARLVAEERQRLALEAAERARTEAERAVAQEQARLLGVSGAQSAYEADLLRARQALNDRSETALGFHRRAREAIDNADPAACDLLYDELRTFLRQSRDELAFALAGSSIPTDIPTAGPDRLTALSLDVDRTAVDAARNEIEAAETRLRTTATNLRHDAMAQLYDEIRGLNADRLALLRHLSPRQRQDITAFGPAGFDQAWAEFRQVALITRYHLSVARAWLRDPNATTSVTGFTPVAVAAVGAKWMLCVALFVWWRRRGAALIAHWRESLREHDRRRRAVRPGPLHLLVRLIEQTRRPLENLLLVWVLLWMLPTGAQQQLEIALVTSIFVWSLGSSVVVAVINALAGNRDLSKDQRTALLRLRSLRVIGRTVVAFGLFLSLSDQLVGEGTIYSWVFSICWFAALPVLFVVVRWWQDVIFQRVGAARRHRTFTKWVLARQSGWRSFFVACVGGAYLSYQAIARVGRAWFGKFDITRRLLAYLFRRGLDRRAGERQQAPVAALDEARFAALGPETASATVLRTSADKQVQRILHGIEQSGGGVFAVVGERGSGKTTVLRQVRDARPNVFLIDCTQSGLAGLQQAIAAAAGLAPDTPIDDSAAALDAQKHDSALIIDNAHLLIRPTMGGLSDFDRLTAISRAHSSCCSWFFAIDNVIWRFFERARGTRPLFDDVIMLDPWTEQEVAELVIQRCTEAQIEANFTGLLDRVPSERDEGDLEDAVAQTTTAFYRLLWDYSGGNPAVALHTWRQSLGLDEAGQVRVRLFQPPDSRDLERLPDATVFVIRAVVQLEPATATDVAQATLLRPSYVDDALRYGVARGYFVVRDGQYSVTWEWFRTITRFLQRRHLLATHQ